MDQFLAELKTDGERSHFAVDWARARDKMGAHLDLEAADYACHFAQLAYHLGASEVRLTVSGEWLEWSCDGRSLETRKMVATAAGELHMGELDLCLNFCLQSVLLSHYPEKVFCSGGRQLHYQEGAWKFRDSRSQGTRLQLRLPWKNRLRNFLRSAWWRKLPELARLQPRLLASPLRLVTPPGESQPDAPITLEIRGQSPLGSASQAIRLDYPELEGSCWLTFQGGGCEILSQGLSYSSAPFLPGRLWLALGDPPTDLGRRQLALNADFQLARSRWLHQLSLHFGDWLEHPGLVQAGVREWLLACLVSLADLEGGEFRAVLWQLPLVPTLCHGYLTFHKLEERVAEHGCPVIGQAPREELEGDPFVLVVQDARLLAFLRLRFGAAVRSGDEDLERLRRWRSGAFLNLQPLELFSHNWSLQAEGWSGGVAFDPSGTVTRLDLYRRGRLQAELGAARGLVPGFWVVADHQQLDQPDQHLSDWIRKHQIAWLAEVFAATERSQRFPLMERVLATEGLNLGPLLKVELWPGLTLEDWLADGQRHDLRRWVDASIPISSSMRFMLEKKFGHGSADEALARAVRYRQQNAVCPEQPLTLPEPALVHLQASPTLLLGLGDCAGVQLRLYRRGRLLAEHRLERTAGLPDGLLVAAEHDHFRLALDSMARIDPECEGYRELFPALEQNLKTLLAVALEQARPPGLAALASLPRRHWPSSAPLFERLDGSPVSLAEALRAEQPQVLLGAAARVPLAGFEDCWWLTAADHLWLEGNLRLAILDRTRDYNEAYKRECYQQNRGARPEGPPAWRDRADFQAGSFRASAGLVARAGPAHLCETTFLRAGLAVMRCSLKLREESSREADEQLICQVEWEDIPFVENYRQLLAQPVVLELLHWLRDYAFVPPLPICDFQLARIEGQAELAGLPLFDSYEGKRYSLDQLGGEVIYGSEEEGPGQAVRLPLTALEGLRRLLPATSFRHFLEPAPDALLKQQIMLQPPRQLRLPDGGYALRGGDSTCIWGLADRLSGPASVKVLWQGRPAGELSPDWPLEVHAEVLVQDLRLAPDGQILDPNLDGLYLDIQDQVLQRLARPARLRLALLWLQRDQIPEWAGQLPDLARLQHWWQETAEPRPYVFGGTVWPTPSSSPRPWPAGPNCRESVCATARSWPSRWRPPPTASLPGASSSWPVLAGS